MIVGDRQPPMIERARECALIDEALEATRAGAGILLLLDGERGIGKTRLLSALHERAQETGTVVLHARASKFEREFAFCVVRQLFEAPFAAASGEERAALSAGPAAAAVRLLGETSSGVDHAPDTEYEILHGLYRLCVALAEERRLVISIDDVHWADAPSLRFINYLLGRLPELGALITLASATDEPEAGSDLLSAIAAEPLARVVVPAALSRSAVEELVDAALGSAADGALAQACHEATGGNPFLVQELLAEILVRGEIPSGGAAERLREIGPPAIARAVLPRLSSLGPHAAELAKAIAVLGDAELRYAAALAELDEATAARLAGEMADANLLAPGVKPHFVHPVVRAAIYEDIPAAERAAGHGRAARMLADDDASVADVAAHLVRSSPSSDPWVLDTLREAASGALADGAPGAAAAYLRRALGETSGGDRPRLLADLARAELRLGQAVVAVDQLTRALELSTDAEQRAAIGVELGGALVMAGRCADAGQLLADLLAEIERAGCDAQPRLEAELIAAERLHRVAGSAARDSLDAPGVPGRPPAAMRVRLATAAFETVADGGDARQAADLAAKALAGGALLDEEGSESLHHYFAAWTLALCDRIDDADHALCAAIQRAQSTGSRLGLAAAFALRCGTLSRRGLLEEALTAADEALDAAQEGWTTVLPLAVAFRSAVLLERDEPAAASTLLDEADNISGSVGSNLVRYERGRLQIATGALEDGLEDLLELGRAQPTGGVRGLAPGAWQAEAAVALARLDRRDEAERLAREGLEIARGFGTRSGVGTALRAAGLAAHDDGGPELLRRASDTLRQSPAKLELARTLVDLGAALRRRNRRSAAREELRAGLEIAERCAATALVRRAQAELQAAGSRPRRPLRTGVDSLTASERRVAEMAAGGRSNREISQDLFITVKTVEWHLGQTYRKLDVRGRKALPAALGFGGGDAGGDAGVAPDAK